MLCRGLRLRCRRQCCSGELADRAEAAQAREESVGVGDVSSDLRAKFFDAAEFLLFSKTLPEAHLDAFRVDFRRIVEQMSFDAERRTVEGRTRADVRDGAMTFHVALQ